MRYAIIGAGGIGSGVAGFMALAGIESVMVARPAHSQAVSESGLKMLDGQGGERFAHPKAVSGVGDIAWDETDLALLTVKSYDTVGIAESLARLGMPIPPVVCVQNGIDNESVLARFGITPVAAVARFKARLVEPGVVLVPGDRSITLGRWGSADIEGLMMGLRDDLQRSGITSAISEQIEPIKWSKLIANSVNIIYALTGTKIEDIHRDPYLVRSINRVWSEARQVLTKAGIEFTSIPDLEIPLETPRSEPDLADETYTAYHGSTWDDISRGKSRNEVPWFNGEIVRLAQIHGLHAPLNRYLLTRAAHLTSTKLGADTITTRSLSAMLQSLAN